MRNALSSDRLLDMARGRDPLHAPYAPFHVLQVSLWFVYMPLWPCRLGAVYFCSGVDISSSGHVIQECSVRILARLHHQHALHKPMAQDHTFATGIDDARWHTMLGVVCSPASADGAQLHTTQICAKLWYFVRPCINMLA